MQQAAYYTPRPQILPTGKIMPGQAMS